MCEGVRVYARVSLSPGVIYAVWFVDEGIPSRYGCAGSVCRAEASQRDPQVARQAGAVTKGGPMKAMRGTPEHMPLRFLVFIGADGCYESMRKCEDDESGVE